ncbi:MAG: AraC family transcriptional regulator [Myxococcota bacterium]
MMAEIAATALTGYQELVHELGGDPLLLLERVGIPRAVLEEPRGRICYASSIRLLEITAEATDCPDFGLRLSRYQDPSILGPLAVAAQNSRTLGEAFSIAANYFYVHTPAVFISLDSSDGAAPRIVFELALRGVGLAIQDTELCLALSARAIEDMTGRGVQAIRFRHPRVAPTRSYLRHFRCPVDFNCQQSAVVLGPGGFERPITRAEEQLRELAEAYLQLQEKPHVSVAGRVRTALLRALGTGASSCDDIASSMAVHRRTLQRKLKVEGTTFEAIKDQVRASLARQYLMSSELSISQIAVFLDYQGQSALTRSCHRWFGTSPTAARATLTTKRPGA